MSRVYGIQPWDMERLLVPEYRALGEDLRKMDEASSHA